MHKDSRKPQAYPWICRGFARILDALEIGADQVKNRSIWLLYFSTWCAVNYESDNGLFSDILRDHHKSGLIMLINTKHKPRKDACFEERN